MSDDLTAWKPVPGYESTYLVSTDGQVSSVPRPRARGGPLKIKIGKRGYPAVTLVQNGIQRTHEVHRLIALTFIGPRPDGQEVRHIDGNPLNCTLSNLAYGTRSENNKDAVSHGTHPFTARTHCPQGHPYDDRNTRLHKGRRYCRACYR